VLYQNDDFGKDYLKGVVDGLGDKADEMIKVKVTYETTDPTVDSQVVGMKAGSCDVFVNTAIAKFAAQAIRKAAEIEWKPLHILRGIGNSVAGTLKPAGFEASKGIITDFFLKDPTDPQWKDDAGYKWWLAGCGARGAGGLPHLLRYGQPDTGDRRANGAGPRRARRGGWRLAAGCRNRRRHCVAERPAAQDRLQAVVAG
jgi:hypothetical protein